MRAQLSLLILLVFSGPLPAAPDVVVSIRPLHSLVSAVMSGAGKPALLLTAGSDPHHFSLRPSQRRQIADAELVVWVGAGMEAALANAVAQSDGVSLELLATRLPDRHAARTLDHGHREHTDPHIWLSPRNAAHIVETVAGALVELDAANRAVYETNRDGLIERIGVLGEAIGNRLAGGSSAYIADHDAYQYFEKSFALQAAGFIRDSEDVDTGARQVSRLTRLVDRGEVTCIVYDAPSPPAIIRRLDRAGNVHTAGISTLGNGFAPGAGLWFEMMDEMGRGFARCLR